MKTIASPASDQVIFNLNSLLRGEIAAVETYNQAIKQVTNEPVDDLIANRNCHGRRVELLSDFIAQHGGSAGATSGMWGNFAQLIESGAGFINATSVIAALEEGEYRGVELYRNPGDLDPSSLFLIQTVLLRRQLETHERMIIRKLKSA